MVFYADCLVALRKESVDRNIIYLLTASGFLIGSLSARRAWIEMETTGEAGLPLIVSLSARRAWIEI